MDADRDEEQDGVIEIEINGDALGGREAGGRVLAAVARYGRQQVRDLTHLTGRVIDAQGKKQNPLLVEVVQIFYHAAAGAARPQTSITQSPVRAILLSCPLVIMPAGSGTIAPS
jgi:hypothetical protein